MTEGSIEASMDQSARWRTLLDTLAARQRLTVAEASALLGVSTATVRRDFTELARQQLAVRTHGGITATGVAYDLPARYRVADDDPRQRIARRAVELIAPGSVVAFNGGTTTSQVVRNLTRRTDLGVGTTVVTNALNIASELVLRPHIRTVCLGGEARPESYELHGPFASRMLSDLLLDQLILGVDAISTTGASCQHLGEAGINAEMVAHARDVVVVAAAAKLGRTALSRICTIDQVNRLVTDNAADPEQVAALRTAGVEVYVV